MISYDDILRNMKNAYFEECGQNPDMQGDLGIRLKAVAGEVFNLGVYADYVLKQSSWKTATGEYLDSIANECSLQRRSGRYATGKLTFYVEEPNAENLNIPIGTICCKKGAKYIQYKTTEDGVIPAGNTKCTVCAEAMGIGKEYCANRNDITIIVNPPISISGVYNDDDFEGGWDVEDDETLRNRIEKSLRYPANALNIEFVKQQICRIDGVISCNIVKPQDTIYVYVKSGYDRLPQEIESQVEKTLSMLNLIDIPYSVRNALPKVVNFKVEYTGDLPVEDVHKICADYIDNLPVGSQLSAFSLERILCSKDKITYSKVLFNALSINYNEYAQSGNIEVYNVDSTR